MIGQSLRRQKKVLQNNNINEFCEKVIFWAVETQKESDNSLETYNGLKKLHWKLDEYLKKIELQLKKVQRAMAESR